VLAVLDMHDFAYPDFALIRAAIDSNHSIVGGNSDQRRDLGPCHFRPNPVALLKSAAVDEYVKMSLTFAGFAHRSLLYDVLAPAILKRIASYDSVFKYYTGAY
jgi:hypothetical protein